MKRHLNCFNPNSIELRIFCGLYFDFVLSTVIKHKALVGVLSSSIGQCLSTLPGSDFPAATEQKHITDLFCFERAHYTTKFFIFFMFSFMAYANLATSLELLETELTNITTRQFCSLPVFCIEHSFIYFVIFYFLLSEFFSVICLF